MIDQQRMMGLLLTVCPSFTGRWNEGSAGDWVDENGTLLPYLALGAFAAHLISLFRADRTEEFRAIFAAVEELHIGGDSYVREAATVGLLESIQIHAQHAGIDPDVFIKWLGPKSRRWWDWLNDFWNGKRPCV